MATPQKSSPQPTHTLTTQRIIFLCCIVIFLGIGLYFIVQSKAATPFPATRDKYKWPFSRYSIWNMPIGSGAQFKPSGIKPPYSKPGEFNGGGIRADTNPLGMDPNAPVKTLNGNRVHVPADLSHDGSWNGCTALVSADDPNKIYQGQPLNLSPGGNPSWPVDYSKVSGSNPLRPGETDFPYDPKLGDPAGQLVSLTGYGRYGCHGATATSGVGGAIRKGELTGTEPIRHVLKFQPYCYLYCHPSGRGNGPFKWPAYSADKYWADIGSTDGRGNNGWYNGGDPDLQQGSLLALKGDFNVSALQSNHARKIAQALKDYGAYMVDDAAWNVSQWTVEKGEPFGDGGSFDEDMKTIINSLNIVVNNSSTSVGGGGNPRVCYAPPFSNGTDDITTNPNGSVAEPSNCNEPNPTTNPSPSPEPTISSYDANIDGIPLVGVGDLSILIANYGKANTTRLQGDLDANGTINVLDLSRLIKHWGQAS